MSNALSQVFERASLLPEADQEALVRILTAEIDDLERQAGPQSPLAKLGRAAWAEHEDGRTRPLP